MPVAPLPPIIALLGQAGVGKSTVARVLRGWLAVRGHHSTLRPMAGVMRAMLRPLLAAYGLDAEAIDHALTTQEGKATEVPGLGCTPRHLLQTLGTEWGRSCISPGIWLDAWAAQAAHDRRSGSVVIVDDLRFPNEAQRVRDLGGSLVLVARPRSMLLPDVAAHASEQQQIKPDSVLVNDHLDNLPTRFAFLWPTA